LCFLICSCAFQFFIYYSYICFSYGKFNILVSKITEYCLWTELSQIRCISWLCYVCIKHFETSIKPAANCFVVYVTGSCPVI
jgi:hypothetical protein